MARAVDTTPDLLDCDVLTGFLGSGKTTLLNAFLKSDHAGNTAVLVNEAGAVAIDHLVLASVTEHISLLESGCLCCTLTGSLRESVLDLLAAARAMGHELSRLVIETSGLSEPAPILHSLLGDAALTKFIRLNQVVVTVDAIHIRNQLDRHPECARQLAAADLIVVTKNDLDGAESTAALQALIQSFNPHAEWLCTASGDRAGQVFTHRPDYRPAPRQPAAPRLFDIRSPGNGNGYLAAARNRFHDRLGSVSLHVTHPVAWPGLAAWWRLVTRRFGDDLLRCKGLLRLRDASQPCAIIQGVGRYFHSPLLLADWPDQDERGRLVCIGADLDAGWLHRSLPALRITEPGLQPANLDEIEATLSMQQE